MFVFLFFLKRFFNSSCSFLWLWCHKNETSKNSLKGLVKNPPNVLFNINFEPNVESPAPSQSWCCSSPTGPKPVHHLIHSPSVFQLQQFHSGPHISGCYVTVLFFFFSFTVLFPNRKPWCCHRQKSFQHRRPHQEVPAASSPTLWRPPLIWTAAGACCRPATLCRFPAGCVWSEQMFEAGAAALSERWAR